MHLRLLLPLLFLFGAPSCGKEVAKVELSGLDTAETKEVELAAGAEVRFPVHLESYSYSGRNYITVQAELMKDGAVIETMRCRGYEFEGGAGSGCGSMHLSSGCTAKVPAGGADAVRVTTSLEDKSNTVELEGLAVGIRVPE